MAKNIRDKFKGCRGVRLTHNGMQVNFFDTYEEALKEIETHMSKQTVSNKLGTDCEIKLMNEKPAELIIFEYMTLYKDVYIIESL